MSQVNWDLPRRKEPVISTILNVIGFLFLVAAALALAAMFSGAPSAREYPFAIGLVVSSSISGLLLMAVSFIIRQLDGAVFHLEQIHKVMLREKDAGA